MSDTERLAHEPCERCIDFGRRLALDEALERMDRAIAAAGVTVGPAPLDVELLARAMYSVDAWDDNSIDRQHQIEDAGLVASEYVRLVREAQAVAIARAYEEAGRAS